MSYTKDLIMKLGLPPAKLTVKQLQSSSVHHVRLLSQVIGVTIGCLLGMWPLLFVNVERRNLKSSFEDADLDGSGKLSSYELTMALHRSGLMMDPDEIKWLVSRFSKDGDKDYLTFEEFVLLVQHWNQYNHEYLSSRRVSNEIEEEGSKDSAGVGEEGGFMECLLQDDSKFISSATGRSVSGSLSGGVSSRLLSSNHHQTNLSNKPSSDKGVKYPGVVARPNKVDDEEEGAPRDPGHGLLASLTPSLSSSSSSLVSVSPKNNKDKSSLASQILWTKYKV